MALPAILTILGTGVASLPVSFVGGIGAGFSYSIVMILSIAVLVLGGLALPGLFNRKRSGWVWSYYARLLGIITGALSFKLIGVLISLLFLMLLFQVRAYYN